METYKYYHNGELVGEFNSVQKLVDTAIERSICDFLKQNDFKMKKQFAFGLVVGILWTLLLATITHIIL